MKIRSTGSSQPASGTTAVALLVIFLGNKYSLHTNSNDYSLFINYKSTVKYLKIAESRCVLASSLLNIMAGNESLVVSLSLTLPTGPATIINEVISILCYLHNC